MVTCSRGMVKPHALIAHLTRDLASRIAESGIPTMLSPGIPPDVLTSTLTGTASMPLMVAVKMDALPLGIVIPAEGTYEMTKSRRALGDEVDGDDVEPNG